MALTRPIPEEAMLVVELIRERIPRPKELPVPWCHDGNELRWKGGDMDGCCPMGMDPSTLDDAPTSQRHFIPDSPFYLLGNKPIEIYAYWWDTQTDAQAAVDATWGEQG